MRADWFVMEPLARTLSERFRRLLRARAFFIRYRLFIPSALLNSFLIVVASVVAAIALAWVFVTAAQENQ